MLNKARNINRELFNNSVMFKLESETKNTAVGT
jgi:hypothetical protein